MLTKTAGQKRHRVEDELSSQAKAGLRMLFALDEQRVAQGFTSSFPSFVKIMKKFNVSGSYTLVSTSSYTIIYNPHLHMFFFGMLPFKKLSVFILRLFIYFRICVLSFINHGTNKKTLNLSKGLHKNTYVFLTNSDINE